ncbi:NAD(+) synthase [bacterium]|nr:NAD(+) synthase [bacterium]
MENNIFESKFAIAQINSIPGDIEYNKNKIIENIKKALDKEVDLIIFPEVAIYGYHNDSMIKKFPYILSQIRSALIQICDLNLAIDILVGYPEIENNKVKSSFAFISRGEIKLVKQFKHQNKIFKIASKNDIDEEVFSPGADYLICAFSTFSRTNREYFRAEALKNFARRQNKKCIYVNRVGADDELVYDGLSRMYDENGNLLALAKAFEEDLLVIDYKQGGEIADIPKEYNLKTNVESFSLNYENDLERTYNSIIFGIKEYFSKNGFKQAVLGLSGGLDSTICAVLLADALGTENVLGVSMPSRLTSDGSKNDAYELAKNLGINFIEAPIKNYHDAFSNGFGEVFNKVSSKWCNRYTKSFTEDNIQARSRAMILWGIANEFGSTLPIATSDKSECYMGYATINGDMSGGFAPIADVCKTKLFALARWMNENRNKKNAIPESVILKPPGAELAIDSKTGETLKAEDALMPYEFLDEVIWRIENLNQSINNMMQEDFLYEKKYMLDSATKQAWLDKFFKRMKFALYKWYIIPPFIVVDSKSINRIEYSQPIVSNINYMGK